MKLKTILLVIGSLAVLSGAFLTARSHSNGIRAAVGVGAARGAVDVVRQGRQPLTPIGSVADAQRALRSSDSRFISDVGLTATAIAGTHAVYTFDANLGNFAAGTTVYKTPVGHGGFCLTFVAPTACTQTAPSASQPVIGLGFDPDAERAGQPFVLVGLKQGNVRSVSYSCAGTAYPAKITGDVVTFISPNASLSIEDCSEQVTFANGQSLATHL